MNESNNSAMAANQEIEDIAPGRAMINTLVFNGESFHIREEDSYWDATRMCQVYGKRINNFFRSESTQRYLAALSKKLGIPIEVDDQNSAMTENQATDGIALERALIYKSKGGDVEQSGTWVHRRVALKLAAWLNEDFEVWVYEVIEQLLSEGQVHLRDKIESLAEALHLKDKQLEEVCNEYALLEHRNDQLRYENDELADMAQWRIHNSFTGRDR
jgi:hypothetical protein